MSQPDIIYADRIVNLAITGSVVRIELGVVQMPDNSGQPPKITPTRTLVIPIDGFVSAYGMLEQMMKKLAESGVIKAAPPKDAPLAAN